MAAFRLFFKRAPETKHLLQKLFQEVMNESTDTALKQRATFYYRLMRTDIQKAKALAEASCGDFTEFFEDKNDEVRERLF